MMYSGIMGNIDPGGNALPNAFSDSTVVQATESTQYLLMAIEPQTEPSCQVIGPDGTVVPLNTQVSQTSTADGVTISAVGYFEASTSGSYDLTCQGAAQFTYFEFDASALITSTLLLVGGILLGVLGFIVAIIGLIAWLVGRNKYTYS